MFFGLRLAYNLIDNEYLGYISKIDNLEDIRQLKSSIIWRQHLPMKKYRECQYEIILKVYKYQQ